MSESRPPLRVVEGGGRPRPPLAPALELGAVGLGLCLTVALLAALPGWHAKLGTFQAVYAVAFGFSVLPLLRMKRYSDVPHAAWIVVGVALATRLALLPVTPSLSDDIHRYVWEGRVIVEGGNPYVSAPEDPSLAPLRDEAIYPGVNHKHLATIYPPVAEGGFALVAAVSPTVLAMKTWVVLHDMALVIVLLLMLRRRRLGVIPLVAYAWNPLVLVEFAGTGHNDPTAMLWLAVAFHLMTRRPTLSAIALAAGALVKLVPLLALPFLFREWTWRARATCIGLLTVGLGSFWVLTRGSNSGLRAYADTWRNNELVFHYLERWTGDFGLARGLVAVAVAALILIALWKAWETVQASRLVVRVATVIAPVVHPWYLGWMLMFEPLAPSAPWLLLSLTTILNYGWLATPPEGTAFHLPVGGRWVEYGLPVLLGVVLAAGRWVRGRKRLDA